MVIDLEPQVAFRVVDLVAVLANAILGGMVARELKLDPVGFAVLAMTSGLGGGVIRDTLLQQGPPIALTDLSYLLTALTGALITYLLTLQGRWPHRFLIGADMLGLGCWSATGTAKALTFGLDWLPAVLLGVTTAVGGGMIRDLVVGRTPRIFGGNTLYASGALVGSLEMVVCYALGRPNVGMAVAITTVAVITLLAHRHGWRLPDSEEFGRMMFSSSRSVRRRAKRLVHLRREPDETEPASDS